MQRQYPHMMRKLVRDNAWHFAAALVCTVITVAIEFITPVLLAETLDYYLQGKPSRMPGFVNAWVNALGGPEFMARNLWIVGLMLVGLNILSGVFGFGKGRAQAVAGENVSLTLRESLYGHIQRLPFSYHVKAETGDLVQRCTSDVETVRRFLSMQLMQVVNALLAITIALVYLFRENVKITLISMIMIPGLFLFAWLFFRWVIKNFRLSDEAEGKMSAVLQENLTGVRVVRAFGQQEYEVEKFEKVSSDFRKKSFKLCNLLAVYWATSDFMSMTQSMITLLACVYFASRGEITVGGLIIFTTYIWKLLWPIRQLGRILSDAGKSKVAMDRIQEILGVPEEPEEPGAKKPPLKGDIVFDHVSFGYAEGRDVLSDMSFTIPAGKTVAILGATGSGKSTVVHLIQRLFDVERGEIRIGGVSIQDDPLACKRSMAYIPDNPDLYDYMTGIQFLNFIGDVFAVPADVRQSRIRDYAGRFELTDDLAQPISAYSHGMKQKLAIISAWLHQPKLILMDEPFVGLDPKAAHLLKEMMHEVCAEGGAIFFSTHVLEVAEKLCHKVAIIRRGVLVRSGTMEEVKGDESLESVFLELEAE